MIYALDAKKHVLSLQTSKREIKIKKDYLTIVNFNSGCISVIRNNNTIAQA